LNKLIHKCQIYWNQVRLELPSYSVNTLKQLIRTSGRCII